jgi:hypothetical protein
VRASGSVPMTLNLMSFIVQPLQVGILM